MQAQAPKDVPIEKFDPIVFSLVAEEIQRQKSSIEMIPSSNIPIPEVNEIGVVMGNKSAPGVPGN